MLGIFAMFLILFRNLKISLIGVIQTLLLLFNFGSNWNSWNTARYDDYSSC